MATKTKATSQSAQFNPTLAPGWDIFTITYQLPNFGSDPAKPTYGRETVMMVGTKGGRDDAQEACEHYHKGCKILSIQSRMEVAAIPFKPKKGTKK